MDGYTYTNALFGDSIEITLFDVDEVVIQPLLEEVYAYAKRLERIFNVYDPKSELSELNKNREKVCSPELISVLKEALFWCEYTQGAYDISLGNQFLARKHKQPLPSISCTYKNISIKKNKVTLTHDDVMIDLSSIAKGYIVDSITNRLINLGFESGIVNGRGDIRVFGPEPVHVDIEHPRDPTKTIKTLSLQNQAVATSGDYRNYDTTHETSHLIHNTNLASVTVVAPTAQEADVLATVFSVLPTQKTNDFLKTRSDLTVIRIDKQMNLL